MTSSHRPENLLLMVEHLLPMPFIDGRWNKGSFEVTLHPGWKSSIELMVSQDVTGIQVKGQKDGPQAFDGYEKVELVFNEKEPIVLNYEQPT